ncbi:helix-turn-helix domain-containing protein [Streptomyces sp. HUAS MG47]|uniref:GlxA family transcriptional regulator n=1 Tax=Streptomyces solicamelliae TaxID=3231716 RepID=UPI00387813B6
MERRIVVVGYDGAELLEIASLNTSLAMANVTGQVRPPYRVLLATPGGRPIACPTGLVMQGHESLERLKGPLDTLIVAGGFGFEAATADARIVAHVRRLAAESRRVASVCTGAGILAAAGLLDGRRATTHWRFADRLAQRHPAVEVDATPLYIRDGNVLTAAGVTSALDLALAIVEEDHGPEPARRIARELVIYLQRPGNQAQMSIFTTAPPVGNDVVRRIATHIAGHLGGDLSAPALAALAGVSERHLTRLFREHLGATPGRYVRRVRTEAAAHLLAGGTLPLAAVAARCGFGTAETLRQAFVARYGISPSRYRAASTRT